MVPEASLEQTDAGLVPKGEGWFVVNAREARWLEHETFGSGTVFEGEPGFTELGINIGVLEPGQPSCMYHRENAQEDFLVLFGECVLLVEGGERRLKAWDFVHCPPGTNHVFVGAGDGPSAILAVGRRPEQEEIVYPVDDVALKHGAGVETETPDPKQAYAPFGRPAQAPYRGQLDAAG
ncbi:MAG TPA: cupin domain-containing protein [Gaiellaceae bacterium]